MLKDAKPEFDTTGFTGALYKSGRTPRRPDHGRDHHRDHYGTLTTYSPRPLRERSPRAKVPASHSWAEEHGLVEFSTSWHRGRRFGLDDLSMMEATDEEAMQSEELQSEMVRRKTEAEEWAKCERAQHPLHYYRAPPADPNIPAAPDRPTRSNLTAAHPRSNVSARPFRAGDAVYGGAP